MPSREHCANASSNPVLPNRFAAVRPERGNLVANYDPTSVKPLKVLRCEFRKKYDVNLVRNTCLPGNQSSLRLNERGPALNVFWILEDRDWAPDPGGGLLLGQFLEYRKVPTKNGPEGACSRKAWLSSVQNEANQHRSTRART